MPLSTKPYRLSHWFADHLGVDQQRKADIYCNFLGAVTLQDMNYWLQVLFSAGIATLGLVLNSPAVIIGAMLISPLMGPILATGLALAAGDLILAVRAIVSLNLSCLVAVVFATGLIVLMPFKDTTAEIAARTAPNALDLVIALFSGALGAIATCKEQKGMVTSIPGVAIAVALMPPLCVVGYGLGFAFSFNLREGLKVAWGGGLLFLTNLTAITFMAMLVFVALNIGSRPIQEQVKEWHRQDPESNWIEAVLELLPTTRRLRAIGSLRNRLIVTLLPLLILLIPLSQGLKQLQQDIASQQQDNLTRRTVTSLWQKSFAQKPNSPPHSFISQLSSREGRDRILEVQLTVFTSKVYSEQEKQDFEVRLAQKLNRPPNSVALSLIEIPIANSDALKRIAEERERATQLPTPPPPPTLAELQASFLAEVETALQPLRLPLPAELCCYEALIRAKSPLTINLFYLSERDIEQDGQTLLIESIKDRLNVSAAQVTLVRLPKLLGVWNLEPVQAGSELPTEIAPERQLMLNRAGQLLQQHPNLTMELIADLGLVEPPEITQSREETIRAYLQTKWQIPPDRLAWVRTPNLTPELQPTLRLQLKLQPPSPP